MALNKNALIRYKTIDRCLQNKYRQWTLEGLMEACSDALYEYEGREVNVSRRTVQLDIQMMRSDKLGYHAPIVVYDKKFYKYEDPNYAITNIPLREKDMNVLAETVNMLGQFKDFSLFQELGGIIKRLEDKVQVAKTNRKPIIHLDKNESLKGLEYLDRLYSAISKKQVLRIAYQSFTARNVSEVVFHPFLLKEYNNRWFLIGKIHEKGNIITFALDRIQSVAIDSETPYLNESFDGEAYYQNTIGATVLGKDAVHEVILKFSRSNTPYVLTKPLHASQEIVEEHLDRSATISLKVYVNFELERLILGFGDHVEVIAPKFLKKRIRQKLQNALNRYEPEA